MYLQCNSKILRAFRGTRMLSGFDTPSANYFIFAGCSGVFALPATNAGLVDCDSLCPVIPSLSSEEIRCLTSGLICCSQITSQCSYFYQIHPSAASAHSTETTTRGAALPAAFLTLQRKIVSVVNVFSSCYSHIITLEYRTYFPLSHQTAATSFFTGVSII